MEGYFEIDRETDNMFFCDIRTNRSNTPHFHSNIEIVYVLNGKFTAVVNGVTETLGEGSACVSNSYDVHSYDSCGNARSLALVIPVDQVNSFSLISQTMTFATPFMKACPCSRKLNDTLIQLVHFNNTHDSLLAKGYAYEALGLLIEQVGLKDRPVKSNSVDLMRRILLYLEYNYLRNITVEGMAKKFGYNEKYISHIFKANLGCGFSQYINTKRARYAGYLIRTTGSCLDEISFQSGFNTYRTFDRAFRLCYQTTPALYKKKYLETQKDSSEVIF